MWSDLEEQSKSVSRYFQKIVYCAIAWNSTLLRDNVWWIVRPKSIVVYYCIWNKIRSPIEFCSDWTFPLIIKTDYDHSRILSIFNSIHSPAQMFWRFARSIVLQVSSIVKNVSSIALRTLSDYNQTDQVFNPCRSFVPHHYCVLVSCGKLILHGNRLSWANVWGDTICTLNQTILFVSRTCDSEYPEYQGRTFPLVDSFVPKLRERSTDLFWEKPFDPRGTRPKLSVFMRVQGTEYGVNECIRSRISSFIWFVNERYSMQSDFRGKQSGTNQSDFSSWDTRQLSLWTKGFGLCCRFSIPITFWHFQPLILHDCIISVFRDEWSILLFPQMFVFP